MIKFINFPKLLILIVFFSWTFSGCISCFAQESANLGIFDATADWGLEPEFGTKIGKYKVPGRVKIAKENGEYIYDVYGNGNDIWGKKDEAFFLYSELKGSWQFSARVQFIKDGEPFVNWAKACLVLREKAEKQDSKYYQMALRSGNEKILGNSFKPQWTPIFMKNRIP